MKTSDAIAHATGKITGRTQDEIRREIVRILGESTAMRLFTMFAGTTVTFPLSRQGPSFTALSTVIGNYSAERLCEQFGGEQVYVPRDTASDREKRNAEIAGRIAAGISYEQIAREFWTTTRNVRRIVKATAAKQRGTAGNERNGVDMGADPT